MLRIILSISVLLLFFQCSVTQDSGQKNRYSVMKGNKMMNPEPSLDLTAHLRKFSGVVVTGQGASAEVFVRSYNKNKPSTVFFVDGKQMYSYADAHSLTSNSLLTSIQVLKDPSDIAFYGVRGADGVVLILTQ